MSAARAEILGAAAQIIAAQGFAGMSMRDLARATDRSLATLYHHFDSKEEVLAAVHCGAFQSLIAAAEKALSTVVGATPSERLHVFVLHHVRFVAEHRDVMRVLVREASAVSETDRNELRALKTRYFVLARDLVRALGGADDEMEIERSTYALFGMLNWTWAWYDPARHGPPEAIARTVRRCFLGGVDVERARPPLRVARAGGAR